MEAINHVMAERLANTIMNIKDSGVHTAQEFYSEFKVENVGYVKRTYAIETRQFAGEMDMRFAITDSLVSDGKSIGLVNANNVQSATCTWNAELLTGTLTISTRNLTLTFDLIE